MAGRVDLTIERDVARITLHNPEKLNALTGPMLGELDAALGRIEAEPAVRAVVVGAAPARAFCAGADVNEWSGLSPVDMGRRWVREGNRVFARLAGLDAVSVAVIGADAFGGGLELALAADFRVAAAGVRLGLPETGIGAVPGWLGGARLAALAGAALARRMVLLGETLDAQAALACGLVDAVAPAAALEAAATRIVEAVRSRSGVALGVAKRVLAAVLDLDRLGSLHELAATACRASPEGDEGIAAFKQKRKAVFAPS